MSEKLYKEKRFANYREIVNYAADTYKDKAAFQIRDKAQGGYRFISYEEVRDYYYALCAAFIEKGYKGKRIAIMGKNSCEWSLCYLAASTVGCVVPIDKEVSAEDASEFMKSAECVAMISDKKLSAAVSAVGYKADYYDFSFVWDCVLNVSDSRKKKSMQLSSLRTSVRFSSSLQEQQETLRVYVCHSTRYAQIFIQQYRQ